MKWHTVETKKGTRCRVLEGGSGAPVVFLHSAGGLLRDNSFLDQLAQRYSVFAPEWPGYGESTGEELLEDMLDFALHGWDLVDALGLRQPHLVGHSMGGMIAAEMACLAPRDLGKLVLVGAAGLWMDEHPIPDIFAMLPHQIAEVLFADPQQGQALLTGGADLSDMEALKDFYVASQRRLAMAGKILFPIPNRRLSKRLYRLTAETLVLCMGEFGRTPKINEKAGRDHWGPAASILFAGAGVQGGKIIGATDRTGAQVTDRPVRPADDGEPRPVELHLADGQLALRQQFLVVVDDAVGDVQERRLTRIVAAVECEVVDRDAAEEAEPGAGERDFRPDEVLAEDWVPHIPGITAPGKYEEYAKDPWKTFTEVMKKVNAGTYEYFYPKKK